VYGAFLRANPFPYERGKRSPSGFRCAKSPRIARAMLPNIPAAVRRPLSRGTELVRGALGGLSWGPALAIAKPAIESVLSQIEVGTLLLVDETAGTRHMYGQSLGGAKLDSLPNGVGERRATTIPRVEVVVKRDAFWMRLFLFADMGFAESYMLGDFECADLTAFFQVSCRTRRQPRRPVLPHLRAAAP